jgi:hypothetical protein
MRKKPAWQNKARKEYETSDFTLAEIAKKYKKCVDTVNKLSAKEKWNKNQIENYNEITNEIANIKQEIVQETAAELKEEIKSKFYDLIKEEELLKQKIKIQRMRRAFGTVQDLYDKSGNLKKISNLSEDEAPLVAGIKVSDKMSGKGDDLQTWTEKEFKFINSDKDLEALEKMYGMYEQDNDQKRPEIDYSKFTPEFLEAVKKQQRLDFERDF